MKLHPIIVIRIAKIKHVNTVDQNMEDHPFKMAWKNVRTFTIFDTVAFYIDV